MYTETIAIPLHIEVALSEATALANRAKTLTLNALRELFATLPHKAGDHAVIVKKGKRKVKAQVADVYLRPTDKLEYVFKVRGSMLFRHVHVFDEDTVIWED